MRKSVFFYILLMVALSLFASCGGSIDQSNQVIKRDADYKELLKQNLIGKWGGLGAKQPVWDIRKDSIYYFESSKAYKYKVVDNDMIVNFEGHPFVMKKIRVVSDTLFFTDTDSGFPITSYRFK